MKNNFSKIELLVCDFDGVLTDNKVYSDENGIESVRCDRSDSLGIDYYKKDGREILVISKETNKVVKARCDKLGIRVFYGIDSKLDLFKKEVKKLNLMMDKVCYVGNDINDFNAMRRCGHRAAPADAAVDIKDISSLLTKAKGGHGVIRELFDKMMIR